MGRTRRVFTPEHKDEAVKLVINTGRTVATVARALTELSLVTRDGATAHHRGDTLRALKLGVPTAL